MKRLASIFFISAIILSLIGCSGDKNLEELLDYINNDITGLSTLEEQISSSFNSIVAASSNEDEYQKKVTATMNLIIQLNSEATKISYTLKNEELIDIHNQYIDYTNQLLSAFSMLTSAIQTGDESLLDSFDAKIEEAIDTYEEYEKDFEALLDKYSLNTKK